MKRFITLGIALILSACANPDANMTRDDWLALKSKTYKGKSPNQVIKAAETVIRLSDPNDVSFSHNKTGFVAKRDYTLFLVLAAADGSDTFALKTKRVSSGTEATLELSTSNNTFAPTTFDSGGGDAVMMDMGNSSSNTMPSASYRAFWERLDYALSVKGSKWRSCSEIKNTFEEPGLCGVMVEDLHWDDRKDMQGALDRKQSNHQNSRRNKR
jgi:hypothetical protein